MISYSYQGYNRIWKQREEEENRIINNPIKNDVDITISNDMNGMYIDGTVEQTEVENDKWDNKKLITLLRFYAAHRCLWDVRDQDYRNVKLRKAALIDIATAIGEEISSKQVLKKINILRATYRYEKKRIKNRMRKGMGAKTKLKWFGLADAFLRNVPRSEKAKKTDTQDSDSDLEDTVVFSIDPEALIQLDETEDQNNIDSPLVASQFETENIQSNVENGHSKTMKWTSDDSIKFINLVKKHSVLWKSGHQQSKYKKKLAILEISKVMSRSPKSIYNRLLIFKSTFKEESQKIVEDKSYKPNLIWWDLSCSFMNDSDIMKTVNNQNNEQICEFLVPTTIKNEFIKQEEKEDNEIEEVDAEEIFSDYPINPIPSVPPPSVNTLQYAVDVLFNKDTEEMCCNSDSDNTHNIPTENEPNPKIICNGLEEDLLQDKWSLKHSVKFLRLYGAHSCLWKRTDPEYNSRMVRRAALEDIAAAMGNGLTIEFVATKIRIFRVTYMQQRKRMLEAIDRGEKAEFKLKWFPLADSFLRPHIGLKSIKEPSKEIPQFDYQYVYTYLNLIDPELLTDFHGKGTQNTIAIGCENDELDDKVYDEPLNVEMEMDCDMEQLKWMREDVFNDQI